MAFVVINYNDTISAADTLESAKDVRFTDRIDCWKCYCL